jgi:hypothetical protein
MNKEPELRISVYGTKVWLLNGELHREDGPAIERINGSKAWYVNGKLHREDGPANETVKGYKEWAINGQIHRVDGPAVIFPLGEKRYYLNNNRYSSRVEWFQKLTPEQQYNYLWNLDEY